MVGQLLNLAHFLDTPLPDPEQVIEVPKILSDDVPMRTLVREARLAVQLVEVPTIVSWSLLQRTMEHFVDIPVPGRGRRISGLQGFPMDRVQQCCLLRRVFLSGLWSRSLISLLFEAFLSCTLSS